MHRKTMLVSLMALFFLASVSAFAGDKAEVKGMITARTGETLIVKSGEGSTTVVLTDDTKTKEPLVIFGFRIIGEDHSRASLAGLHDQRFSGPGSDHSFDFGFVTSKRRYRCQKEQCHQTYQHRFSVHNCLPFFSLNSDGNVRRFSPRLNISAFLQTWPLIV